MNTFNYVHFKNELKTEIRNLFEQIVAKEGSNNICGFAVFSDESARSISIAYEVYNHLKSNYTKFPDEKLYYKWYQDEWLGDLNSAFLGELNNKLFNIQHSDNNSFSLHRNEFFKIAVEALSELKGEHLFDGVHKDFVLKFAVTDFDNADMEIEWIYKLNDDTKSEEFREWRQSW